MSELSTEHANPTSPEVRESPRVKVYERPELQRWFRPALLPAALLLAGLIALLILVLA